MRTSRFLLTLLPALLLLPACTHSKTTTTARSAATTAPDLERFMKIRAPRSVTLTDQGAIYAIDWPEGVNQLFRRPPNTRPSSPMTRLTDFQDGVSSYSLSPDESHIVVSAAVGGSEQNDLHLLNTETDEMETLLTDPNIVYNFAEWRPDSRGFIYTANVDSPAFFHLYHYDLESRTSEKILGLDQPGYWFVSDIAKDATRLIAARYYSVAEVFMYELDLTSGDLHPLTEGDAPGYNIPVGYLPGEDELLFISDRDAGFRKLFVMNLDDRSLRRPGVDLDDHEIDGASIDRDREYVAVTQNEDGYGAPHLFALPDFAPIQLPDMPRAVVGAGDIENGALVWSMSNARMPGIYFAWDIGAGDRPRQLTAAHDQGLNLDAFPLPELIRYESFDGLEVPAFVYTPRNYEPGNPIPFIAWYHGGPESQTRPSFNATIQYYLSRGFGVIQPNVRGSTGYGRQYHQMDNYKGRWDSVRDGVEAVRWLIDNGYTKKGHVASYGGSYGGFMSVATLIEGGDLYGAGVNIVGIVNFQTFLQQTKSYRRELRETEYGPLSDPEFLASVSPINRIEEINVPMLIAHGLNDPRVPVGEAMQLAVELQQRGYDPELLFFPDEGHGFRKLDNRLLFAQRTAKFLEKHIGF